MAKVRWFEPENQTGRKRRLLVAFWNSWLPYSTYLYLDFHLFHDKAKRTQQGNLPLLVMPHFHKGNLLNSGNIASKRHARAWCHWINIFLQQLSEEYIYLALSNKFHLVPQWSLSCWPRWLERPRRLSWCSDRAVPCRYCSVSCVMFYGAVIFSAGGCQV